MSDEAKKMISIMIGCLVLAICIVQFVGYREQNIQNNYVGVSAGIYLHGGASTDKLRFVENKGTDVVRINHVSRSFTGETVLETFILRPSEKRSVKAPGINDSFIIIDANTGVQIGFISGNPPRK